MSTWNERYSRRTFVGGAGALALAAYGVTDARATPRPHWRGYPFTLGVASGDPRPDGVVLWTRLAPDPLSAEPVHDRRMPVRWEIARDEAFRRPVRHGRTWATPELGHSVHVEPDGLEPDREYFFRFASGGEVSPVGRTRTAPHGHGVGETTGSRSCPARTGRTGCGRRFAISPRRMSRSSCTSATRSTRTRRARPRYVSTRGWASP